MGQKLAIRHALINTPTLVAQGALILPEPFTVLRSGSLITIAVALDQSANLLIVAPQGSVPPFDPNAAQASENVMVTFALPLPPGIEWNLTHDALTSISILLLNVSEAAG